MTDPAEQLYLRVLVLRAQAGDEAAFAELAGRYEMRPRYYLRKMLGNVHVIDATALNNQKYQTAWQNLVSA